MDSFMACKNLFGCFRQVSAVATERFLLSQLAKTSQKSSQNPLKINLNSFLELSETINILTPYYYNVNKTLFIVKVLKFFNPGGPCAMHRDVTE